LLISFIAVDALIWESLIKSYASFRHNSVTEILIHPLDELKGEEGAVSNIIGLLNIKITK